MSAVFNREATISVHFHSNVNFGNSTRLATWPEREPVFRRLERDFAEVQKMVLDHDDLAASFSTDEWAINYAETETPIDPMARLRIQEKERTLGVSNTVDIIRESSDNLLNLINDILDFSKIEAGHLAMEMIDCSLGKLLNSIESMMKPQAEKKTLAKTTIKKKDMSIR